MRKHIKLYYLLFFLLDRCQLLYAAVGRLQRDRSPPTTAQRSQQPSHKKTVSNTTLYAYARRNTQTVTTEHKRSDFIIAELDKMQMIQNRKQ